MDRTPEISEILDKSIQLLTICTFCKKKDSCKRLERIKDATDIINNEFKQLPDKINTKLGPPEYNGREHYRLVIADGPISSCPEYEGMLETENVHFELSVVNSIVKDQPVEIKLTIAKGNIPKENER